jgi:arginine N-succinyltransferase
VLATADEGMPGADTPEVLVSNTELSDFRMVLTRASFGEQRVALSAQELSLLHCQAGDQVRTLALNVRKNTNG